MKLSTLKTSNSRDGSLCVVNRSLTKAILATEIAPTLQYAIDHWHFVEPRLQQLSQRLNADDLPHSFDFDPFAMMSPLPRAYQWADGSAFVNHVELVRKARNTEMPERFWTEPLMYQGGSDEFLSPTDPIAGFQEAFGIDFEAEVGVITNDVPMGVHETTAENHILLLLLVNDVTLRHLIPDELAKGFGFFQSKPASSFSPIALTPDELGSSWDKQRLHLHLYSYLNGKLFGKPNAGVDMTFSFPQLIAHAAKTRRLGAGTIIGSGTVSNLDRSLGSSCIIERRMIETLEQGQPVTPFLRHGDEIRIEMLDENGKSIFGAIQQQVHCVR